MLQALSSVLGRPHRLLLPLLLPLAMAGIQAQAPVSAAGSDDRAVLQRFASSGEVGSRRLQEDLARSGWSAAELRAALVRAYGVKTTEMGRFLSTSGATELLRRQLPWWSPELAPQLRLAALRAAVVADSRDGSISLLGVLLQLPVVFTLANGPSAAAPGCGCPQRCGDSALAHLAFLIACLQSGSSVAPPR